jgi:hypothetical protein
MEKTHRIRILLKKKDPSCVALLNIEACCSPEKLLLGGIESASFSGVEKVVGRERRESAAEQRERDLE